MDPSYPGSAGHSGSTRSGGQIHDERLTIVSQASVKARALIRRHLDATAADHPATFKLAIRWRIHHSTWVETETTNTPTPTSRKALIYSRGPLGRWGERVITVLDLGARRRLIVDGTTATLALIQVEGEDRPRWMDAVRFDPEYWGEAVDRADELAAVRSILGRMREELVPTGPVRGEPRGDEPGSMAPLYSVGDR